MRGDPAGGRGGPKRRFFAGRPSGSRRRCLQCQFHCSAPSGGHLPVETNSPCVGGRPPGRADHVVRVTVSMLVTWSPVSWSITLGTGWHRDGLGRWAQHCRLASSESLCGFDGNRRAAVIQRSPWASCWWPPSPPRFRDSYRRLRDPPALTRPSTSHKSWELYDLTRGHGRHHTKET